MVEQFRTALRNWWAGAFGRHAAFLEGRNGAVDNAAMKAYDMGRPDLREAINNLVSPPRGTRYASDNDAKTALNAALDAIASAANAAKLS